MYYRWNETVHFLFRDGQFYSAPFIGGGNQSSLKKTPTWTYLFESLLFKESILSGQIRESEAIIKLLNFLA
jgi:hypothetical protein